MLTALGFSTAEIAEIRQGRCNKGLPTMPGKFRGRNPSVATLTFRLGRRAS
jgi:hypothetical protein